MVPVRTVLVSRLGQPPMFGGIDPPLLGGLCAPVFCHPLVSAVSEALYRGLF